jgi:hypothetical protein
MPLPEVSPLECSLQNSKVKNSAVKLEMTNDVIFYDVFFHFQIIIYSD